MSRYINPIGFRLSLLQLWNTVFYVYGKNFKIYNKLVFNKKSIQNYIRKSFKFYRILTTAHFFLIHSKYVYLITYNFQLQRVTKIRLNFIFKKIQRVSRTLVKIPLISFGYTRENWSNTSLLFLEYIKFSFRSNKISLKVFIRKIEPHLLRLLNKKVICRTISSSQLRILKGIKICCKGRFGNLRNPLTQTFKKSVGSVSLSTINSYIDYSQDVILTKKGLYGIKIWIFYS